MGRIDEAIATLESIEDGTERALQLAGLISTVFKLKNIALVVTGQLAFDSYANSTSPKPHLELATFTGQITPRIMLEIMRGQLHARGSLTDWTVAGIPVRFIGNAVIANREMCRDFMTDHGVVKLLPAEEITADCILAAVYPEPDGEAETRARLLLINGLTDAFHMNWTELHALCHRPEYRIGEDLAKMRLAAKKDIDLMGIMPDPIGVTPLSDPIPEPPKPKKRPEEDDLSILF